MVRTHHLPPPAKTARGLGFPPPRGPSCLVSSCVIPGQETSPHHGGYGHIADGIGVRGAVHRTACFLGWRRQRASEARGNHWRSGGLAHAWSMESVGPARRPREARHWRAEGTPSSRLPRGLAPSPCRASLSARPGAVTAADVSAYAAALTEAATLAQDRVTSGTRRGGCQDA
jgi:hypothetical protein